MYIKVSYLDSVESIQLKIFQAYKDTLDEGDLGGGINDWSTAASKIWREMKKEGDVSIDNLMPNEPTEELQQWQIEKNQANVKLLTAPPPNQTTNINILKKNSEYKVEITQLGVPLFDEMRLGPLVPCVMNNDRVRIWAAASQSWNQFYEDSNVNIPSSKTIICVARSKSSPTFDYSPLSMDSFAIVEMTLSASAEKRFALFQWNTSGDQDHVLENLKKAMGKTVTPLPRRSGSKLINFSSTLKKNVALNSQLVSFMNLNDKIFNSLFKVSARMGNRSITLQWLTDTRKPVILKKTPNDNVEIIWDGYTARKHLDLKFYTALVLHYTQEESKIRNFYSNFNVDTISLIQQFELQEQQPDPTTYHQHRQQSIVSATSEYLRFGVQNNPFIPAYQQGAFLAKHSKLNPSHQIDIFQRLFNLHIIVLDHTGSFILPYSRGYYAPFFSPKKKFAIIFKEAPGTEKMADEKYNLLIPKNYALARPQMENKKNLAPNKFAKVPPHVAAILPSIRVGVEGAYFYDAVKEALKNKRSWTHSQIPDFFLKMWKTQLTVLHLSHTKITKLPTLNRQSSGTLKIVDQCIDQLGHVCCVGLKHGTTPAFDFWVQSYTPMPNIYIRLQASAIRPLHSLPTMTKVIEKQGNFIQIELTQGPLRGIIGWVCLNPTNVLEKFIETRMKVRCLSQILLHRFSLFLSDLDDVSSIEISPENISAFFKKHVKAADRTIDTFPPIDLQLAENFKNKKVWLPRQNLTEFKSFLWENSKNPWFVRSYGLETWVDYDAPVVNAEINGIISASPSKFSQWCATLAQSPPSIRKFPTCELEEEYYLQVPSRLVNAKSSVTLARNFDDFQTAEMYVRRIRSANDPPSLLIAHRPTLDFKVQQKNSVDLYIIGHREGEDFCFTVAKVMQERKKSSMADPIWTSSLSSVEASEEKTDVLEESEFERMVASFDEGDRVVTSSALRESRESSQGSPDENVESESEWEYSNDLFASLDSVESEDPNDFFAVGETVEAEQTLPPVRQECFKKDGTRYKNKCDKWTSKRNPPCKWNPKEKKCFEKSSVGHSVGQRQRQRSKEKKLPCKGLRKKPGGKKPVCEEQEHCSWTKGKGCEQKSKA
jgi:hypothetical protein